MILISFLFSKPVLLSDVEKVASIFLNQKTSELKKPVSILKLQEYSNITVINFSPSGFVLSSNDDQIIPILAYSLNKNFNSIDIPIDLKIILSKYEIEINELLQNSIIDDGNSHLWTNLLNNDINI